ncbi:type I methionyl aminopeptidase [Hydrogenothermus marinus]|uniref:Methionine aminopeptidase n=1 Tax=Hydrogenothermus marinus TaxID=133270 RepID=A0A3M0BC26_9AQUI|nr:type I methionyl aminopeptidase [Hydrogenothermus marinus]RMA92458.1 methionine aminopeptidase type I [Hydrogenothermus marinus]
MIELKTKEDIEKLRVANKIVAEILQKVKEATKPGMTGIDLDRIAREETEKRGVKPAFLGLYGFPAALCVSINEEIVHGIPKDKPIKEGDVVSIDFGVVYEGWYGDAAITYVVGNKISERKKRLLEGVEKALMAGIEKCIPGNNIKDIAAAIEGTLKEYRLAPICDYGGHGIGRKPHEEPHVSNCIANAEDVVLKEGMVLAIEPMATLGKRANYYRKLKDGWTIVSKEKAIAAHFEHSVAITENGPEILSKLD